MSAPTLRHFASLDYRDPVPFLQQLHSFELEVTRTITPAKIKNLRTNALKEWRELRQAAMFCYLVGQRIGHEVLLARGESQDYDFVATWVAEEGVRNYAPVQLKELVPTKLNASATLQALLIELPNQYVDSRDLTVVIHLNQNTNLNLREVAVENLRLAGLWMFGAVSEDLSKWGLWGNFLRMPEESFHEHPAA